MVSAAEPDLQVTWNRNNNLKMVDVGAFHLETDLPKFLESVLQNTENVLVNLK